MAHEAPSRRLATCGSEAVFLEALGHGRRVAACRASPYRMGVLSAVKTENTVKTVKTENTENTEKTVEAEKTAVKGGQTP